MVINYGSSTKSQDSSTIRRTTLIRAEETSTVWPGEFVEFKLPEASLHDSELAVEPRLSLQKSSWLSAGIHRSVGNTLRVSNNTSSPQLIKKHEHICQVTGTFCPEPASIQTIAPHEASVRMSTLEVDHSAPISLDPDKVLPESIRERFNRLHQRYSTVFDPAYSVYNHAFGKFEAVVNMGIVQPPQRKGKLPQYSRDKLTQVQEHMDKLEDFGVLAKPESLGITVEYLNPSFLVKKSENSYRLVTAFTEVGKYCKTQPTLLPTVDSTLRTIANWKYLVASDLKSAYYQIPLSQSSMKYCGTVSPYKGTRVYTRCAMGMPGSETALEELLSRILGDLIVKGVVAKLADDLYCGGRTPEELFNNWSAVLESFRTANLKLSSTKTVIAPKETTILGWVWKEGQIRASPHKVAALVMCSRPVTVKDLRSFLGAYKVLAIVIPQCSMFLRPLTRATAGKASQQKIDWDDSLISTFESAQGHLQSSRAITIPRIDDQLWIVTDGATSQPAGIGATLYVVRKGKALVAVFLANSSI